MRARSPPADSQRLAPRHPGTTTRPQEVAVTRHQRWFTHVRPFGLPLALTSRREEYIAAVDDADVLTAAACIEIDDLSLSDLEKYLPLTVAGQRTGLWDPVLAHLRDQPNHPTSLILREVLSTPLMVLLAKTIYSDTPDYGSPMVLLNSSRFTTATLIREHLFDQFIPAAYRVHPASSRRTRWSAQRAEQWLIFLAHDMERRQQGGSDIAWWRLSGAVPRPLIAGSFGAISGLSGALLFPFPANLGVGLVLAVTVVLISRKVVRNEKSGFVRCLAGGILGGVVSTAVETTAFGVGPHYTNLNGFLSGGLAFAAAASPFGGFATGFIATCATKLSLTFLGNATIVGSILNSQGFPARIANGLGLGLVASMALARIRQSDPSRRLRWSPWGFTCGVTAGLILGIPLGLGAGFWAGLSVGLIGTVGGGVVGALAETAEMDLTKANAPASVLRRDRLTFWVSFLGLGAAAGVSTGLGTAQVSRLSDDSISQLQVEAPWGL